MEETTRQSFCGNPDSVDYQPLIDEEDSEIPHSRKRASLKRLLQYTKLLYISAAILLLILVGSLMTWSAVRKHDTVEPVQCGNSSEEAIANGCIMEPMIYGWVPPQCYFEELSSQYSPFIDREWYTDDTFTVRISPEEIWTGKHAHIYAHWYHGQHCLFLWRKLALAVQKRSPFLDTKALSVEHADHCSSQIENGTESLRSTNDVILGFYECQRLPWK